MDLITGDFKPLSARRITVETCRKYGYQLGEHRGVAVHIAPYHKDGALVAQHLRTADKQFPWVGESKDVDLFGQHLCRGGGKRIVITEGEIDCLTISQAFNNKWPVVSIPTGSKGARKALKQHLEFLESYDEIVLAFDADQPGKDAAAECAVLFSPGKLKIAAYPEGIKDASQLAQEGRIGDIATCIFEAKNYRPDGIINGAELWESIQKPIEWGLSYPWDELTKATYGQRMNELVAIGSGTGMGKTDLVKEMVAHNVVTNNQKVGLIFLEESNRDTALGIMNKFASKLFHIPGNEYTEAERREAYDATMGTDRVFMYDHFGHTDWDSVKSKIRFMAVSCGCTFIYLDHITALVSGDKDGDERKILDALMTDMASLVRELHINIHFISHLSTPEGKPHEEGGRVMIRHFRGSRAIGQWSSFMFALERNQQEADLEERHISTFRILKDRYTGRSTGFTMRLKYGQNTGRLTIAPPKEEKKKQETFGQPQEDF
jgi:twinkle protein